MRQNADRSAVAYGRTRETSAHHERERQRRAQTAFERRAVRRGGDASHPTSATTAATATGLSGIFEGIVLRCTRGVAECSGVARRHALDVRRMSGTVGRDGPNVLLGKVMVLVGCSA